MHLPSCSNIQIIRTLDPSILGAGMAFLGAIMFSAKAVFVRWAYIYEVDPISLLAMRMLFSLPFYLLIAVYNHKYTTQNPITKKDFAMVIAFGVLGFYLASLFDFIGLQYISASLERLILFVYPTIVVILAAIFFKRKIRRFQYLALLLTYAGILVAFSDKFGLHGEQSLMIGILWVFASAFTYACYLIGTERLIPTVGAIRFTAFAMIAACMVVLTHQFVINRQVISLNWQAEVYYLGICTAIISTVIPSFLFSKSIQYIGASHTAVIASVGPISTIILAWYFLDEQISVVQLLGTFLVLFGVTTITRNAKKAS